MDPGGPRGAVRDRRHHDPGEDDDGHEDHCLRHYYRVGRREATGPG